MSCSTVPLPTALFSCPPSQATRWRRALGFRAMTPGWGYSVRVETHAWACVGPTAAHTTTRHQQHDTEPITPRHLHPARQHISQHLRAAHMNIKHTALVNSLHRSLAETGAARRVAPSSAFNVFKRSSCYCHMAHTLCPAAILLFTGFALRYQLLFCKRRARHLNQRSDSCGFQKRCCELCGVLGSPKTDKS